LEAGHLSEVVESLKNPVGLGNAVAVNILAFDLPTNDVDGNGRRQDEFGERLVEHGRQGIANRLPEGWVGPPLLHGPCCEADLRRRLTDGGGRGEERDRLHLLGCPAVRGKGSHCLPIRNSRRIAN
jgi:hypothetical protein